MAKSNPIGKQLVIAIVAIGIVFFILSLKSKNKVSADNVLDAESATVSSMPESENNDVNTGAVDTGVVGDTYVDTINTLTAQVKILQEQVEERDGNDTESVQRSQELEKELEETKNKAEKTLSRYDEVFEKLSDLENNLKNISVNGTSDNLDSDFAMNGEYPINNGTRTVKKSEGIPKLTKPEFAKTTQTNNNNVNTSDEVLWINPIDATKTVDESGMIKFDVPEISIGTKIKNTGLYKNLADTDYGRSVGLSQDESVASPFITIPRGATSIDAVSLTALIGRIPIGGTVVDAYRFKALISSENLASNGVAIDGLTGAIVGGRVSGDYSLKCVSGHIEYITFTFQDGTISTFPESGGESDSGGGALGYISDNAGVPCISGTLVSNGVSYLSQQMALTALNAGANAYAQSGVTTSTTPEGSTSTVTDPNQYALGEAVSGGINNASKWSSERQQSAFDAIYVPPASRLTVHLEQEITINFNPNGRKTNHAYNESNNANGYDYSGLQ